MALTGRNYEDFFLIFLEKITGLSSGDASVFTDHVADVIVARLEAYIPSSSETISSCYPRFSLTLRSFGQETWRIGPTVEKLPNSLSFDFQLSSPTKDIASDSKHSLIYRTCENHSSSSSAGSFWSLAKNIS